MIHPLILVTATFLYGSLCIIVPDDLSDAFNVLRARSGPFLRPFAPVIYLAISHFASNMSPTITHYELHGSSTPTLHPSELRFDLWTRSSPLAL